VVWRASIRTALPVRTDIPRRFVVVVIIGTILVATLMMPLIGIMLMQVDMLLAMLVTPSPAHRSHVRVGDRSGKHRGPDQSGDVHVRSRCRRRAAPATAKIVGRGCSRWRGLPVRTIPNDAILTVSFCINGPLQAPGCADASEPIQAWDGS
jgi:hypothetical protein